MRKALVRKVIGKGRSLRVRADIARWRPCSVLARSASATKGRRCRVAERFISMNATPLEMTMGRVAARAARSGARGSIRRHDSERANVRCRATGIDDAGERSSCGTNFAVDS